MKKIFSLFVALTAVMSLSADSYFLKSNWGKAEASWKEMTFDEDDWYSLSNEIFDGKDFAINTEAKDEGARVIKAANVLGSINTDDAELAAGDSVLFVFRPSLVNQYDEKESGLYAMISKKNGYAIRGTWGEKFASWKNLPKYDEESFSISNVLFDGQNVQILAGKEVYNIKPENIQALMMSDYSDATLEAGDIVLFSFTPDERSAYDETKSGLMALIIKKHGYALQSFFGEKELSWKEFVADEDKWIIENSIFDGHELAINNFASALGARKIEAKHVQGYVDADFAELSAGDSVLFVYDPESYASMDPKKSGLSAIITKKNGYAIKIGDEWKNLIVDAEDDDWWTIEDIQFDGKAVQILHDKKITSIKPENIAAFINYDAAQLSEGDSVMFIFRPSLVNSHDEKQSGLQAMITKKNGYAIRGTWGEDQASWKNLEDDKDGAFFVDHVLFDGQNVQVIAGKEIYTIKPENIKAADYTDNEVILEAGDSVLFSFNPEYRSAYDEKESGLSALILKKHGYALQSFFGEKELSWKAFVQDAEDADWFVIENSIFDGHELAINNFAGSLGARKIAAKNVQGFIDADFAELSAGDSVRFIFRPSLVNSHDEKQSGLQAMITKKNGYAIKINGEWKNLIVDAEDDDWWTIDDVTFDGKPVQIVHDNVISTIKPENIKAYINLDDAELSVGDKVMFIFRPSLVNKYDEKESGLQAMINSKNGYAIKVGNAWKNMEVDAEDDDWWTMDSVIFDGKAVQIAHESAISTIKPENIKAYINMDDAELSAGDNVLFIFRPSLVNKYDEKESGLQALINSKNGYAIKVGAAWKNMEVDAEDDDWWSIEHIIFDGKAVQVAHESTISTIKPENIKAYINFDDAELSAGDEAMFIFRPSLVNKYNEKESGLYALIEKKNGYAIRGTWGEEQASWKNMILDKEQEDETYVLDSVIFDGNDVQFVSEEGIRVIKVANIKVYMLEDLHAEAVLEAGDLVMFVYAPDTYNHYDETESGLSALIIKKHDDNAIDNIEAETKAVKVLVNGQLMIIKNGKTYNAAGTLVK